MHYLFILSFPIGAVLLAVLAALGGGPTTLATFAMCVILSLYIFTTHE